MKAIDCGRCMGRGLRLVGWFALAVLPAAAQNLTIVSGNDQITAQYFQTQNPLVVEATDSSGRPLAGVAVNWSLSGPGNLSGAAQTITASNGQTSNQFTGAIIYGDSGYSQSTITASTGSSSVTMYVTTSGTDPVSDAEYVQVTVLAPTIYTLLSDTEPQPVVQVQVTAVHNAGVQQVPNVAVQLVPQNSTGPSLACAPGTGITNTNGIANCPVVFSGTAGTGSFSIVVGGYRTFSPFLFSVSNATFAQPATIVIVGGSNQSGLPGAQLPVPLLATLLDASGNPAPNVPVLWQSVNASLNGVVYTSTSSGTVSAIASLGLAAGPAQVVLRTANGSLQTVFNFSVTGSSTTPTQPTQPVSGQGVPAAIHITGGNNQSGAPGARLPAPLAAQVVDAYGNPLPYVQVTWQAANPQAVSLSNIASTSDVNGNVSAIATLGSATGSTQVFLSAVGGSVSTPFGPTLGSNIQTTFNLTVSQIQPGAVRILSGNNQTVRPGSPFPLPLTAQVEDIYGNPMPNVPVVWQSLTPQSVQLSGFTSTTDSNGSVAAVAIAGSTLGAAQVQLRTANGGLQTFFALTVSTPQPAALQIVSGNNQSGPPGAQLPAPLMARVVDANGNPVPNVQVVWTAVGQSVSLGQEVAVSDANGLVSATATLGSATGFAQVQLQLASVPIQTVFSLQTVLSVTGVGIVAGGNQQANPGAAFAQPLVAQVFTSGGSAAGLQVQFASAGAPVVFSNNGVAITDSNGHATISVQAGPISGIAVVTASTGGFSTAVNLTIQAVASTLSFLNGASGQPGPISPTEIVAMYATGVAPGLQGCVSPNQAAGPQPLLLAGDSVQFMNGAYQAAVPIFAVCNQGGQQYVVVEAPADLPPGVTSVTVQVSGAIAAQGTSATAAASPGILETTMSDGVQRALLQRRDGSYVSLENPAQPGDRLRAFVTGLGSPVTRSGVVLATNQTGIAGDPAPPPNQVTVEIAGQSPSRVSADYSTDDIGVYVVTFSVPSGVPSGPNVPFTVTTVLNGQTLAGDSTKIPIAATRD